jgi:subtilisin family serine protease
MAIAVLDTGIDLNHPAFAGRLVPGYDFVDNDNDPSEVGTLRQDSVYGHGTHVAGIIALTAPNAKIMPLRILDVNGESNLWRVKDAMLWAARNNNSSINTTVINMSFGYPPDITPQSNLFLHNLFKGCSEAMVPGIQIFCGGADDDRLFVVAAAGNGGQIGNGATRVYPAAERGGVNDIDDNLLSVGASTRYDRLASFSTMANVVNRSVDRWVRTVAPGENIVSALPGGRYGMWSGTSMAAPIVSGISALVKSKNPTMALTDLVERIEEQGQEWDCRLPSRNIQMETNRVDAFCALANPAFCLAPRHDPCTE